MAFIASFIIGPGLLALAGPTEVSAAPAPAPASPEAATASVPATDPAVIDPGTFDPWASYDVGFQPIRSAQVFDGRVDRSAVQRIDVTTAVGVPLVDIDAVALRVRIRGTQTAAGVTVWARGSRPTNPTILVSKAADRSQLVIVALPSTSGVVSLQPRLSAVDATVEVVGYVPDASSYTPVTPVRVFDNSTAGAALAANSATSVRIAGVGGLPTGMAAVVVQTGVVSASATTALTLWPTGATRPTSPDITAVNTDRGLSTTTIVPVGADGTIQVHNAAGTTRATLDVVGWFATGGDYRPLARTTARTGAAAANSVAAIALGASVPADAGAAVIALRSRGTAPVSLTVYPSGTDRPTTPTSTTGAGRSEQIAIVPLGADGSILLHTSAALTDLSVDVLGTFARAALAPEGSSWQFDPTGWITLTANAQTKYSNLVNIGADGRPTGAYLPAGTRWAVAGDAPAVNTLVVGRGRVRVRSTDVIGSINVIATPVGGAQGMPLVVKNVRLQPGVRTVADGTVVYPDTRVEGGGSPAPFTAAEVNARVAFPPAGDPDPFQTGARIGVVLRGRAPAVGTVLVGVGASGVTGKVVAPAGLPTISRSGTSLVTVELISPVEVYRDLHYSIDPAAAALVGPTGSLTTTRVAGQATFVQRPTISSRSAAASWRPSGLSLDDCRGDLNLQGKIELKAPTVDPSSQPRFFHDYTETITDGGLTEYKLELGVQWDGKVEFGLLMQTQAQLAFACNLADVGKADQPALDPRLTVAEVAQIRLAGEVTVPLGLKFEAKMVCTWSIDQRVSITWSPEAATMIKTTPTASSVTSTCGPQFSSYADLAVRKVEMKVGVYPTAEVGIRLFGKIAAVLASAAGKADLGVVPILSLKAGPEVKAEWETDRQVLESADAGSKVVQQTVAEAELKTPELRSVMGGFHVNVGVVVSGKLLEAAKPSAGLYRAPNSPTLTVTVNGDVSSGEVVVYPGDVVEVQSTMKYPFVGAPMSVADAPVTGGTDWIETAPKTFERFNVFSTVVGSPGPTLVSTATITPADCARLVEAKSISFLATTDMLGIASTPGWAGKVQMRCGRPTLAFVPDSVRFRPFETGGAVRTVQLTSEHAEGMTWSFVNADDIPAWLTVSDRAGGRFEDDPDTWDIQLSVDCSKVEGTGASTVLTVSVGDTIGRNSYASLSVSTDCQDEYIKVDPSTLTDGGSTKVVTSGKTEDRWTLGALPPWAKASVRFRDLEPGLSSGLVTFTVDRTPTCQVQPETRADVRFTTANRGEAVLTLVRTRIPAITPCPTQALTGDPHLVTADGVQFDAQVVGEYVTARSAAGDFVLSVRQNATTVPGVGRPTSVTAVSMLTDGATIEVYATRAPGNGRVFVNGDAVVIDPNVPLAVTDTVRIARQADAHGAGFDSYTIFGPDGVLLAEQHGSILDVTFAYAGARPDITGLLGTPDGDPSNDLVPRGATTGFTVDEVRGHTPALYTLTDSWRTTDIADTMFTVPDDVFTAHNWPMDAAALAPFRDQAFAALGSITNVCGGDRPGANDYVVDALALELSIGTPVGDLGRFTCNYVATAETVTAAGGYPVPGVQVTFDAPGLRPCTAVSSADGRASCRLVVDLDELAGATGPLRITATAAWPDTPGVLATSTIDVTDKAPLDGTPARVETRLAISVEVPQVTLSGTLRNDSPTPKPWTFEFLAHDAAGVLVGSNQVSVTPAADGSYTVTVPMPPRAVSVSVDVILTDFVRDTHEVTGLVPGTTTAATIDVDDRAQHLRVTGVMRYDGAPAVGTPGTASQLAIDQRDAAGRLVAFRTVFPTIDPVTGAYSVDLDIVSIARTVELRAYVASNTTDRRVLVSTTVGGLAPATSTSTTFDAIVTQPHAVISGTARQGGAPAADHTAIVTMFDAAGTRLGARVVTVDVDPVTARYTLDPDLDQTTTRISVRFQVGALASDNPVLEVGGLAPSTTTNVPFDFDVGNQTLVVSGTIQFGGAAAPTGTGAVVSLVPYDAAGQPIVVTGPFGQLTWEDRPVVGAAGAYQTIAFALPAGTVEVRGTLSSAGVQTSFTTPIAGGANGTTVDLDTVQLVLHGRYELANDGTVFVTSAAPPTATLQGVGAFVVTPEKTYTVTLQFPVGTTDARVGIALTTTSTVVNGLTAGSNDRVFDWLVPDTISVSATVTRNALPATDVTTARLRVHAYHVNDDDTFVSLGEVQLDDVAVTAGAIDTPVSVPAGTNLVDIEAAPGATDEWGRIGAYAVDPGGIVSGLTIELVQYVEVTFNWTDVAPACSTKIREIEQWIVPADAGSAPWVGIGYGAPAIRLGSTLVVPGTDFSETLRIPLPGYFSAALLSHARGDWTSLPEPAAFFQTAPIAGSTFVSVTNGRADFTCDAP